MTDRFDIELKKIFKEGIVIDYGIVKGNSTILLIKTGQDGSLYGYNNKYIKLAKLTNKKYGCTVIVSTNPFDGENPLDNAYEVINENLKDLNNFKIYYLGFSNGALIGAWFGHKYKEIRRMCLVNGPLMYNLFKTKDGIKSFKGESLNLVYGEKDQSITYLPLLTPLTNEIVKINTVYEDHHFSFNESNFLELPDKYLFY